MDLGEQLSTVSEQRRQAANEVASLKEQLLTAGSARMSAEQRLLEVQEVGCAHCIASHVCACVCACGCGCVPSI